MLNNLLQVNRRLHELNGTDETQNNRNLEFGYQVKNNIFGLSINGNNNSSSLSASTTSSSLLLSSSTHGNHNNINENSIHSDTIDVPATTTSTTTATTSTSSISGSGSGGLSITPPTSSRHVNSPSFTEQLGGSFKLMRSLSSITSHDLTSSTTNNNITAAAANNNNNNNNNNKHNDIADKVNDHNVTEANTTINDGINCNDSNGGISRNTTVIGSITDKHNVVKSNETKSIISTTPTHAKDKNNKETLGKITMETPPPPPPTTTTSTTTTSTSTSINALPSTVALNKKSTESSSSTSSTSKESIDSNISLSTSIKKVNIEIPSNNDTNKQTIVNKKELKQNINFTKKTVFHNFNNIFQKASITILQTINYQIPSASLLWKSCWLHGENYR
jgi:hypothetical protein